MKVSGWTLILVSEMINSGTLKKTKKILIEESLMRLTGKKKRIERLEHLYKH